MKNRIKICAAISVGLIAWSGAALYAAASAEQPRQTAQRTEPAVIAVAATRTPEARQDAGSGAAYDQAAGEQRNDTPADPAVYAGPAGEQRNGTPADPAVYAGPAWTRLRCRIYHYCECDRCTGKHEGAPAYGVTATGTRVAEGRTVAVDPEIIPLGSEVLINGHSYRAEDTGVHGDAIDIYVPDHEQAVQMGTYETVVLWR